MILRSTLWLQSSPLSCFKSVKKLPIDSGFPVVPAASFLRTYLGLLQIYFFPPLNSCFFYYLSKSCAAQYPTPRVHFCIIHFIYFYPIQSLNNFSYYLVIPQKFLAKLSNNSNKTRWITPINTYSKTLTHSYSSASKEDSAQHYQIQIIHLFYNPLGT